MNLANKKLVWAMLLLPLAGFLLMALIFYFNEPKLLMSDRCQISYESFRSFGSLIFSALCMAMLSVPGALVVSGTIVIIALVDRKQVSRPALAYCLAWGLAGYVGLAIATGRRPQVPDRMAQIAVAAQPTIEAILAFHNDTGEWPTNLDVLVPRYVAKVPCSTLFAWHEYSTYSRSGRKEDLKPYYSVELTSSVAGTYEAKGMEVYGMGYDFISPAPGSPDRIPVSGAPPGWYFWF